MGDFKQYHFPQQQPDSHRRGIGINKREILRKKERRHAFGHEKELDSRKKERKHAFDQEKRKKTS